MDFTWLIIISHRYILCFKLRSQLTHSILHNDAIARYWFNVIGCLVSWFTFVSHMIYDFCTWLIVMSHWFHACDPIRTHDLLFELWLVLVCCAVDSYESSDGFHTMTHFESWVKWHGGMSHGWGKNPYIRASSGHEFEFFTQPSKLLSLLLIQPTIFISLSCSKTRVSWVITIHLVQYQSEYWYLRIREKCSLYS